MTKRNKKGRFMVPKKCEVCHTEIEWYQFRCKKCLGWKAR